MGEPYDKNNPDDIYARGSIIIKIIVVLFIIILLFNNCSKKILFWLIFLIAFGHLLKLVFVHRKWKEKKREISGLDGPKLYVKISEKLGGPNWHKQDCWPKLFIPTIRVWLTVTLIAYIIFYGGSKYIKIATVISIVYCLMSVYPEMVKIDKLKCDVYGGNFIFIIPITILLLAEMRQK